ncbi:MAG: ECF transporter S component [Anaerovoracaceae bacterium]|nr:ECF transporter S component [Anaerovoracaceae bacterium]
MKTNSHTIKIVLTALMMCIIMISIMFIKIPIPFTQGYVHPGDAMIFLAVLVLGWKYGAVAAAFGGMLGDVMGGFAAWAPWTFCIKGIMAIILGLIVEAAFRKENRARGGIVAVEIVGMIVSGAFMVAAYYVAEGIMYGNWIAPLAGIPWNIGQFAVGMVLAMLLAEALCKTPARAHFAYSLPAKNA